MANLLFYMVRLVGFEPTTYGLEVRCSIQLSYRRKIFNLSDYDILFVSFERKFQFSFCRNPLSFWTCKY
jgi:hypothetical protein